MKKHPIWEYLKQNNMTDLNESDFIMAYSDPEKAKQVWGYIKDNGMTDLDERSFYNSYFSSDTEYYQGLKKKRAFFTRFISASRAFWREFTAR
jgi:hypothetical protein